MTLATFAAIVFMCWLLLPKDDDIPPTAYA